MKLHLTQSSEGALPLAIGTVVVAVVVMFAQCRTNFERECILNSNVNAVVDSAGRVAGGSVSSRERNFSAVGSALFHFTITDTLREELSEPRRIL